MKRLQKTSFGNKIPSIEVNNLIDKLDKRFEILLELLLKSSNIIQTSLLPEIIQALHNKRMVIVRCSKRKLINVCANMTHSLVKEQSAKILMDMIFTLNMPRNIVKNILADFDTKTKNYLSLSLDYFKTGEVIRSKTFRHSEAFYYTNLSMQMSKIEKLVKTNRSYLYGIIKEIREAIQSYILIRNKIVKGNLSLCYIAARNLSNNKSDFEDNYQNSIFGINRAFELYDINKKVPFDKYALYWVNQAIKEKFKKSTIVVHVDEYIENKNIDVPKKKDESEVHKLLSILSKPERIIIGLSFGILDVMRKEVEKIDIEDEYNRQLNAMKQWQNKNRRL